VRLGAALVGVCCPAVRVRRKVLGFLLSCSIAVCARRKVLEPLLQVGPLCLVAIRGREGDQGTCWLWSGIAASGLLFGECC
jgi:hypothetical protein